jgi:uncharacterized membrane protein YiaA
MRRITQGLLVTGFVIYAVCVWCRPDDAFTAALKSAGYYWWVLGTLLLFITVMSICCLIELKKCMRIEAESNYMRTLKGPDLVKYLAEKKGWGKK